MSSFDQIPRIVPEARIRPVPRNQPAATVGETAGSGATGAGQEAAMSGTAETAGRIGSLGTDAFFALQDAQRSSRLKDDERAVTQPADGGAGGIDESAVQGDVNGETASSIDV